ncbi:MAG: D-aminoacyl-tRNA deacylase [Simkaniaceae bacterium]|nr:D-aminoacyl-tRNA deacylase [Simkaniaceae bacterium]
MRLLVQRVSHAKVEVSGITIGAIGRGMLVLVGVQDADATLDLEKAVDKLINLRIFEDKSLLDIQGELLIVSQFTLYADCKKGRRPSYTGAARPEVAKPIYDKLVDTIKRQLGSVQTGEFGADMQVSLLNDGPVTLLLELPL